MLYWSMFNAINGLLKDMIINTANTKVDRGVDAIKCFKIYLQSTQFLKIKPFDID